MAGRPIQHPWDKMQPNDEYVVCSYDEDKRASIAGCARKWAQKHFPNFNERPVFSARKVWVEKYEDYMVVVIRTK